MNMKTVKKLLVSLVVGLMCLGTGVAMAADKGMGHSMADFNKDGMVTEAELVTFVRMHFMMMDKDNDHMVDKTEWVHDWFLDQ